MALVNQLLEYDFENTFGSSPNASRPNGGGGVDLRIKAATFDFAPIAKTSFGGSGADYGRAITTDAQGAAYIVGTTESADLPVKDAIQASYGGGGDAFLAVLAPGSLDVAFATYIGGPGSEGAGGVALDPDGNIYVLAYTESTSLPTSPGAFDPTPPGLGDAYIVKISALGPLARDFSVSADPATLTVEKGQKGNVTIDVSRTGGFNGSVTVTAPDTKAIKVKLTPKSSSASDGSVVFAYKIKKKAAAGSYDLTFSAKDRDGRGREAVLTLVIQ